MASDNDLQLALRQAAGIPIPDTTPPEERRLREENRLRQQIQDVRDDARQQLIGSSKSKGPLIGAMRRTIIAR